LRAILLLSILQNRNFITEKKYFEGQDHASFVHYALKDNNVTPAQKSSGPKADIVPNVKDKIVPVAGHGIP
jgi:hypothetical protein